jgi:hypothetical protein
VKKYSGEAYQRERKYLTEQIPDTSTYEICKEEYPDELIRTFDIL